MLFYPPKDPTERLKSTVDWSKRLGPALTITSSIFTLQIDGGGATIDEQENGDQFANVHIVGGTNGEPLVFINRIVASDGQEMEEAGFFYIQDVATDPAPVPLPGEHVLDPVTFRLLFPAFADEERYPFAVLNIQWGAATGYLGAYDGCLLRGAALQSLLNYMTAHLLAVSALGAGGGQVGFVTSSTIDKIAVQMAAPPAKNAWQYWLGLTPYGLQVWALLKRASAGGFYIGGRPERAAFRKVGGRF